VGEFLLVVQQFADAAVRAGREGSDAVEIRAARRYPLHEFLSPLSNLRTDEYGGGFDSRSRLVSEVVAAARSSLPEAVNNGLG
jgi:2,4-dienoyl-CoA reductase-like NADH-dependent reductase (Old Yellow Enzyme family)